MRSADLIVHYEVFYYGVVPHYEPHSWTSAEGVGDTSDVMYHHVLMYS